MKALTLLVVILLTGCTHPLLFGDSPIPEPSANCCPPPTTYQGWAHVQQVERCGIKQQSLLVIQGIRSNFEEPRNGYYDYEFLDRLYRDFGVSNGSYPYLTLQVYAGGIPDSLARDSRSFLISFQRDYQNQYCADRLDQIKVLEIHE
ncbi:hypothetical protein [Chitinophaga barathri]|uniref:DUF4377 domain-containing protein n=1 Tax=Chitinophaga barathri TaxID=1647451 RepID=A0A3N4M7B8_9BACT|nr:hypothetical protein [Chitinophaga barathri]RPD39312.1 hypothetical protein EG028_19490 [Chitinophaga barathri]